MLRYTDENETEYRGGQPEAGLRSKNLKYICIKGLKIPPQATVSEKAEWKGCPTSHFLIEQGAGCRKGHAFVHSLMVSSTDYVLVCKKSIH